MKLIIDIPEDMYNDANILIVKDLPELKKIIANGIPLPKGHGDSISREQIRKMLNEAFGCENATKYGNKNAEQQALSYSTLMLYEIANIVEDCCDNAPTVSDRYDEGYADGYFDGGIGADMKGDKTDG